MPGVAIMMYTTSAVNSKVYCHITDLPNHYHTQRDLQYVVSIKLCFCVGFMTGFDWIILCLQSSHETQMIKRNTKCVKRENT